jgi:peptide/nickel transport system substrate-binding protein
LDCGEDPPSGATAAEADEIDHIHSTKGAFVSLFDTLDGSTRNEVSTAGTIVFRPNQLAQIDGTRPSAAVRM